MSLRAGGRIFRDTDAVHGRASSVRPEGAGSRTTTAPDRCRRTALLGSCPAPDGSLGVMSATTCAADVPLRRGERIAERLATWRPMTTKLGTELDDCAILCSSTSRRWNELPRTSPVRLTHVV